MTLTDRIEINPRVMLGKPVIRGTRIPVELILRKLSEGASEADLLEGYPSLKREDIQAAMRYAADTLAHEEVVFIGKAPPSTETSRCASLPTRVATSQSSRRSATLVSTSRR